LNSGFPAFFAGKQNREKKDRLFLSSPLKNESPLHQESDLSHSFAPLLAPMSLVIACNLRILLFGALIA
jgi:hypothetical protein